MTTQHTPGPWTTDEADHDSPYQNIRIGSVMHHTVCTVWIDDAPLHDFNAKQHVNARLIAAAPELLEALQSLCDAADESDGCQYGTLSTSFVRNIAHAAIAKATDLV